MHYCAYLLSLQLSGRIYIGVVKQGQSKGMGWLNWTLMDSDILTRQKWFLYLKSSCLFSQYVRWISGDKSNKGTFFLFSFGALPIATQSFLACIGFVFVVPPPAPCSLHYHECYFVVAPPPATWGFCVVLGGPSKLFNDQQESSTRESTVWIQNKRTGEFLLSRYIRGWPW